MKENKPDIEVLIRKEIKKSVIDIWSLCWNRSKYLALGRPPILGPLIVPHSFRSLHVKPRVSHPD